MSGDTIEVDISIDAPALVPGDTASLRFRMTTRDPLRIRGAHAHFIGYEDRLRRQPSPRRWSTWA